MLTRLHFAIAELSRPQDTGFELDARITGSLLVSPGVTEATDGVVAVRVAGVDGHDVPASFDPFRIAKQDALALAALGDVSAATDDVGDAAELYATAGRTGKKVRWQYDGRTYECPARKRGPWPNLNRLDKSGLEGAPPGRIRLDGRRLRQVMDLLCRFGPGSLVQIEVRNSPEPVQIHARGDQGQKIQVWIAPMRPKEGAK